MKIFKHSVLTVAALLLGLGMLSAQDFQTGYFLGGYQYGYRLNPAFQSEHGFVALVLGQTGVNAQSNVGIGNFVYVKDGKTCLFLNNKVTSDEFLGKLNKKENNVSLGVNLNLLAVGFWAGGNFFNIDVNVKSNNGISLPYELFSFLKDGTTKTNTFSFANSSLRSKNYVEVAVGWSRNWNNFIIGGARLKSLTGIAELQAQFDKLDLVVNSDKWVMESQGSLYTSSPAATMKLAQDGSYDFKSLAFDPSKLKPCGYGAAVDLGIVVNPLPWLTASLAILDLGFMTWDREIKGITPETSYTWDPRSGENIDIFNSASSGTSPMDAEFEKLKNVLSNIYKFKPLAQDGYMLEMLPFRMNIGIEARLPMYKRLSLGLLYSMRHGSGFNWNEGRISINWNPLDMLSISGSTSFNEFFKSFGAALNIHPGVINFFIGGDIIPGKIIPLSNLSSNLSMIPKFIGVPSSNLSFNAYMGLSIAFGKRKVDYMKHKIEYKD